LNVEVLIYKGAAKGPKSATIGASAVYNSGTRISYAAPLVSEYEGPGADRTASTVGGEDLVIKGANFGPPCPAPCPWINKAEIHELLDESKRRRLSTPKVYVMDHTKCAVFTHTRMKCVMPEGAGGAFKVVLTIGGLTSIETQMSYGPPEITQMEDNSGNPISEISTRGSQLIILRGKNFPNNQQELDSVKFGSLQNGFQTYTVVASGDATSLTTPGTCHVVILNPPKPEQIRCLTASGVLRAHQWIITVSGQVSQPSPQYHFFEPTITTVEVETVSDRINNELSLFPTKGSTAIVTGTNFGITSSGQVVPGSTLNIILYPRGDLGAPVEKSVDILKPNVADTTKDRLRFTMPEDYGNGWTMAFKISKESSTTTYQPWPASTSTTKFGYQPPTILHTDTENAAGNNLLIELIGTNFCKSKGCATVYICQAGSVNPNALCFAGGIKANGPHAAAIPMAENAVTKWTHTEIRITPQNNRAYDNRYLFVAVGGTVYSNPAFHSSTNPEIHAICEGIDANCRGYPSVIKASGKYPTDGKDTVSQQRLTFSILATEANLDSNNSPPWASMRISVGPATSRPVEDLITNAVGGIDCKAEDGTLMAAGCTRFTFALPASGWTGLNQPITLWVATIKSNSALMDFDSPRITHIYKAGTTDGTGKTVRVPTGGSAAGGASGPNRKFDIIGSNFGSSSIPNSFELFFKSTTDDNDKTALLTQPSSTPSQCDSYDHKKLSGCKFPEGQGTNYVITVKVFGHPTQTFPVDVTNLINYEKPALSSILPTSGGTKGGYTLTISGTNMGVVKPTVTFGGTIVAVADQANGYHDSLTFPVPAGQGDSINIVVTAGGQVSNNIIFKYDAPTISSLSPTSSETDGKDGITGARILATLTGTNFGLQSNTNIEILFKNTENNKMFRVTSKDIVNITNHNEIKFYIPPGYGAKIEVSVLVAGQESPTSTSFSYNAPSIGSISMDCSGFDELSKSFVVDAKPCYGYQPKGRDHTRLYPSIKKIVVHPDRTATIDYDLAKGKLLLL
jgi:hypothetical protein